MFTCVLILENTENAAFYASSLIKFKKSEALKDNYRLPTPEDPGDSKDHTPIQNGILKQLKTLQHLEQLNPRDNLASILGNSFLTLIGQTLCYNQTKMPAKETS